MSLLGSGTFSPWRLVLLQVKFQKVADSSWRATLKAVAAAANEVVEAVPEMQCTEADNISQTILQCADLLAAALRF